MKRQQLLAQIKEQFPIPSFKELLLTLEALNYDPSWCYFKTDTFENGSLSVSNTCFLQRENQWVVCLADWHSFSDEQSFDNEQEACENFVYKYFLLSNEEINWLKQWTHQVTTPSSAPSLSLKKWKMNTFGRLHSSGKVISTKKLYSCLFQCLAKVKPSPLILLLLLNRFLPVQISLSPKLFLIFKNNCWYAQMAFIFWKKKNNC